MLTVDEIENAWTILMEKYNLKQHPYMIEIYEIRTKWVKPYFKGVLCARMTSTQHNKSANNMLKTYMPRAIAVHMFVSQYIWLQFDRERDESYKEKRTRILKCSRVAYKPCDREACNQGLYSRHVLVVWSVPY
uniref:Protein FAR1-RELATED SEQUENCE n=1 Tax=Triticum urartu TaxID=4572 RepID=A0A8R7P010_TRIUA